MMQSAALSIAARPRLQPYRARAVLLIRAVVRALVLLPWRLRLEWLRWLRAELNPLHPGLNEVMREVREIESRFGFAPESPAVFSAVRRAWVAFVRWV